MESNNEFNSALIIWADSLSEKTSNFLATEKRVFIVAPSRKMSRFFEWMKKNSNTSSLNTLNELLKNKKVEIITEYAIPLIFSHKNDTDKSNIEGIIVDDAVISGSTSKTVALEWKAASGRYPGFSTIFRSKEAVLLPSLDKEISIATPRKGIKDIGAVLKEISKCLLTSSLPIDIEYPIIHINSSYLEVKNHLENSYPDCRKYAVKSDLSPLVKESFSVILDEENTHNYNNDFAKARVFDKDFEVRMEIIAPNAIQLESLFSSEFWENKKYQDLWDRIANPVKNVKVVSHNSSDNPINDSTLLSLCFNARKVKTLIVWTNYLLSISAFIRNKKNLVPQDSDISVNSSDLSLIIGKELAEEVCPIINEFITNDITSESTRDRVALPSYAIHSELKERYSHEVLSVVKPDMEVEDNLDAIFRLSHFSSGFMTDKQYFLNVNHNSIGESYESLMEHLLTFHFDDNRRELKIHRWIDQRIDESRITPKYEPVTGSDNKIYYRRFFFAGSNAI